MKIIIGEYDFSIEEAREVHKELSKLFKEKEILESTKLPCYYYCRYFEYPKYYWSNGDPTTTGDCIIDNNRVQYTYTHNTSKK